MCVNTNDLATNELPTEIIAELIVDLASTLKSDSCSISISMITVSSDEHRKKVPQVNRHLKELCKAKNFESINHDNTITERHLNGSKLKLDKRHNNIFKQFYRSITKFDSVTIYFI